MERPYQLALEYPHFPSDNHVRDTLDGIDTKELGPLHDKLHQIVMKNTPIIYSRYIDFI
jgi:hypothetical protein